MNIFPTATARTYAQRNAFFLIVLLAFTIAAFYISYLTTYTVVGSFADFFGGSASAVAVIAIFWECAKAYSAHRFFADLYAKELDLIVLLFFAALWASALFMGFNGSEARKDQILAQEITQDSTSAGVPTIAPPADIANSKTLQKLHMQATAAAAKAHEAQLAADEKKREELKAHTQKKSEEAPYIFLVVDLIALLCTAGSTHILKYKAGAAPAPRSTETDDDDQADDDEEAESTEEEINARKKLEIQKYQKRYTAAAVSGNFELAQKHAQHLQKLRGEIPKTREGGSR